jgi:hypothetical protein
VIYQAARAAGNPRFPDPLTGQAPPRNETGDVLILFSAGKNEESGARQPKLNAALVHLLSNATYRAGLASKREMAYQKHFSWHAIATRFSEVLESGSGF